MSLTARLNMPEPAPPPPATFDIVHTEGHGTFRVTGKEARELHHSLGRKLEELDKIRADRQNQGLL